MDEKTQVKKSSRTWISSLWLYLNLILNPIVQKKLIANLQNYIHKNNIKLKSSFKGNTNMGFLSPAWTFSV